MLLDPNSEIDQACESFDEENVVVESTLDALMTAFPKNLELTHVHIKVITISQLYRARVKNIDAEPLASHIWSIPDLDDLLAAGSPKVVSLMHDCKTTRSKYYSFATKFCSWHNPEAYSLWDYNVDEALWSLTKDRMHSRGSIDTNCAITRGSSVSSRNSVNTTGCSDIR